MKKSILILIVSIVLVAGGVWWAYSRANKEVLKNDPNQLDLTQYAVVPSDFTWIEENNPNVGITFKRPSFWVFRGQIINNGDRYTADFVRSTVMDAVNLSEQQKYELGRVLFVDYVPNVRDIADGTPEGYLNVYFPVSSSKVFRKKIGNIEVVGLFNPEGGTIHYVFFTKDKVINFTAYKASDKELGVIEEMIASFKLNNLNEMFVTPKNIGNYPLE